MRRGGGGAGGWGCFVKAKIVKTDGADSEIVLEVHGQRPHAMDAMSSYDSPLRPGTEAEVEFSSMALGRETWEEMFRGNPKKEKKLDHQSGWRYKAYGEIVGLSPTIVDCGILQLEGPIQTHDERCIGEFVSFSVDRLDVFRKA